MKNMTNDSTLAPAAFSRDAGYPCAHTNGMTQGQRSTWAAPAQGIAMSAPAIRLGGDVIGSTVAAANAANGAVDKRAAGYSAFEDPL